MGFSWSDLGNIVTGGAYGAVKNAVSNPGSTLANVATGGVYNLLNGGINNIKKNPLGTAANVLTGGAYGAVTDAAKNPLGAAANLATGGLYNLATGNGSGLPGIPGLPSLPGISNPFGGGDDEAPAAPGAPIQMPTNPYTAPTYSPFTGRAGWEGGTDNPWTQMMRMQNENQYKSDQDMLRRQTQGQTATAMDQLAMQGGLAGGAGERLQNKGTRGMIGGMANLARDRGQRDLEIGATGAQQNLDLSKFNTLMSERDAERAYNAQMDAFNTNSGVWAAAMQANATDPRNNDDGRRWNDPTTWINPTPPPGVNYLPPSTPPQPGAQPQPIKRVQTPNPALILRSTR
jgi:hypothetical protein